MTKSKKFSKKADLSINLVIITIIAIVVLIVITYIFTGRLGLFNKKISDCLAIQNAECIDKTAGCDNNKGYIEDPSRVCFKDDKKEINPTGICCIPILR